MRPVRSGEASCAPSAWRPHPIPSQENQHEHLRPRLIHALNGTDNLLGDVAGKTALFVNVASKCGLTPQYTQLQELQDKYGSDDFTVVGFPATSSWNRSRAAPTRSPSSAR